MLFQDKEKEIRNMATANSLYNERRYEIDREIEILKHKLEAMDNEQQKNQKNYGYAGNCGHIINSLKDITNFLK